VSVADCWLLLAVPGLSGPKFLVDDVYSPPSQSADEAAGAASSHWAVGARSSSFSRSATGTSAVVFSHRTVDASSAQPSQSAAAAQRMSAWYFDAASGGALTAMRAASEAAAARCDDVCAVLDDVEARLSHRPRLKHAWVAAAGAQLDAQLRVTPLET